MNKSFVFIFLVITIIIFSNCSKKQETVCLSRTTARVTTISGPNNVLVNQEADLTVTYYLDNGCGILEGLESTSNDYNIKISLIAKYEGCVCTDNLLGGQIRYKFKPLKTGVYYLKFLQPDKTYFSDTITVN